ncbi:MAG: amidase domain-containing protein [Microbacteriaceae bacterium]
MNRILRRLLATTALIGLGFAGGILTTSALHAEPTVVGVDAQLAYVKANWNTRSAEYGDLEGNDCVNFASQSLIARGWEQTDEWWHRNMLGTHNYALAWVSSTAMRDWLAQHPELAVPIEDDARDHVAVGDIVQFDWDSSGNRDHTGIVVRVDPGQVFYASHSNDREEQSVDDAIAMDVRGGTVHYWHLLR